MRDVPESASRLGTRVYSDRDHCITVVGSFIITYSKQPPDAKYFAAWNEAVARLAEKRWFSVVTIIDSGAPVPDEATRKLIRGAMHRYADCVERFAYVVEGTGFGAAAMRSAISLTSLAARTPYRQKVFATVADAGAWLAHTPSKSGTLMDARGLTTIVDPMRSEVSWVARAG